MTIIELIVVIGIIAILTGLLLAGVQRVRGMASRAACQNNMKQLALALHHYHDVNYSLPTGYRSVANSLPYTGWTLDLLPFVEQMAVYSESLSAFAASPLPFLDPPHVHRTTVIKVYTCPMDGRVRTAQTSLPTQSRVALTSYLGVSGKDFSTRDGVFCRDTRVTFADITDGASNTLMIGERPPSADFQFGWWYSGSGQRLTGSADIILGVREQNLQPIGSGSTCGAGAYPFQDSRVDDPCGMFHFWSLHSGGANFAFCDGSVRFVPYSANPIMPALASRAGGEVATAP